MRERILISACLLGCRCRYDGASRELPAARLLLERYEVIPICPEQMGGLPTPRPPAERRDGAVVTAAGTDVTDAYRRGAGEALRLARQYGCRTAVLKERSPSCGHGTIYDGTFSHTLALGDGVTAEMLCQAGIRVIGESEAESLLREDRCHF